MAAVARRNVTPRTFAIAAGVGVLVTGAAAGVWWWQHNRRTYVGSGWAWPKRNLFPSEMSFGEALAELGYGSAYGLPDWEILSEATMETVRAFQRDFNEVRRAFKLHSLVDELSIDGLIGENTIRAFEFALDHNRVSDDSWIALVHDARMFNAGGSVEGNPQRPTRRMSVALTDFYG